jgi:hypothetical protein
MPQGPGASLGATPAKLTASQRTTVLKAITWDENGDPGKGTVHFGAFGGALLEDADVALTDGAATITFRCIPGTDMNCGASVEIVAQWRGVNAPVFVQSSP